MRAMLVAAMAALAVIAAGCGGGGSTGVASGATLGLSAAQLVPPDATAFVSVDSNLDSAQWQRVDDLTKSFPVRTKVLDEINSQLQQNGLSWKDDVAPALGDELDVAAFGTGKNLEYVAYTKPHDAAKLGALAAKLSEGSDKYTVEQIGGWSVVADSQELFDKARAAANGTSLADLGAFKAAWSSVSGDALARAYVSGAATASAMRLGTLKLAGGKADWYGARVSASGDALQLDVTRHPLGKAAPAARLLLADVPSGASLAVAFHGAGDLLAQLAATKLGSQLPVKQLAPLLTGDGVLYLRSAGLIPDGAVELTPKNPQAALAAARALLKSASGKLGPLQLTAQLSGTKLVIADGPAAANALRGGAKLVNDSAYKDAVKSAGVPAKTTLLAYADVTALAPIIELAQGALGGKTDSSLGANLEHVGTVVAWVGKANGTARYRLWVQPK
jgi:hypothetical protein